MTSRESAASQAGVINRSRSVRRRFLIVGVAALAVLGVMMGVSFLDSSGATSLNISSSSSTLVIPLDNGSDASLPLGSSSSGPLTTTAFSGGSTTLTGTGCATSTSPGTGGATTTVGCTATPTVNTLSGSNIVNPSWSPIAGSPGTVTTAGDLAIVDATTVTDYVTVNMYITNLTALGIDYSSFAFPINVYKTTCDTGGNCAAWSEELTTSPNYTYLTDTGAVLTFNLPAGAYYDIVMEGTNHSPSGPSGTPTTGPSTAVGGSFYTTQTNGSGGSLSPSFYFTATAS